jgi:Winged helix DNA-binding domain
VTRALWEIAPAVERGYIATRHGWGHPTTHPGISELAAAMCGLHAARLPTPYVTLAARLRAFTAPQLRAGLAPGGGLVKVRCMRRTLHIVPAAFAPVPHVATRRVRMGGIAASARRDGVDTARLEAAGEAVVALLAGGPLPARDLERRLVTGDSLVTADDRFPPLPLTVARHAVRWMWEAGQIACRNTAVSLHREVREFALTGAAHPGLDLNAVDVDVAVRELVAHYLTAFGPASVADLQWWSGLTRSEIDPALAALHDDLIRVRLAGDPTVLLLPAVCEDALRGAERLPDGQLRLLAFEDPTFKGYFATRSRYVDPAHQPAAFNPIGEVRAAITLAGRIVGTWTWHRTRRTVSHTLFRPLPARAASRLTRQLQAMVDFLRSEPC